MQQFLSNENLELHYAANANNERLHNAIHKHNMPFRHGEKNNTMRKNYENRFYNNTKHTTTKSGPIDFVYRTIHGSEYKSMHDLIV
uniref:Uncharacterized protein n=1 Tax=Glossina palpalis gambiensis TaxID=67801 RepID=A0A1B0BQY0_9MUSC